MSSINYEDRYLKLEDVRVWYDEQTDSVRLLCTDTGLGPAGVHLSIKQQSAADITLRQAMTKAGISPQTELRTDELPAVFSPAEPDEDAPALTWQLGSYANGAAAWAQLSSSSPHLLLVGAHGSGKTEQVKRLLRRISSIEHIDALVIDGSGALEVASEESSTRHLIAGPEILEVLAETLGEIDRRVSVLSTVKLSAPGATQQVLQGRGDGPERVADHPLYVPPMVLIIDGLNEALDRLDDVQRQQSMMVLKEIARKGSAADAHLVLTAVDASTGSIDRALRGELLTVGLSTTSAESSVQAIGRTGLQNLPAHFGTIGHPGGIFRTYGQDQA